MTAADANLQELYRRTVLEHSREPHRFGRLDPADREATGHNPLCGDKCTVYLRIGGQRIEDISFEGAGCAICMASASIMVDRLAGGLVDDANHVVEQVLDAFSGPATAGNGRLTGDMAALEGVRAYPTRIRCATLPWQTARAALLGLRSTVTTETTQRI